MDFSAGLAGLNAAIETLKTLRGIEKAYDQAVLKAHIVELMGHVSDAKAALIEAQDEIRTRDAEIKRLNESLKQHSQTVVVGGYTYAATEDGQPTGAPYCSACLVQDGTVIAFNNVMRDKWLCPRCNAVAAGLRRFP